MISASKARGEASWLSIPRAVDRGGDLIVNLLLVLMVLAIWFLMNHHGYFVQPP